jgi:hypothetical protein
VLVWSLALVREGRDLAGGVLFAVLLNMKHLFACLAPVYFVYLLRHHCRCCPSPARSSYVGHAEACTSVHLVSLLHPGQDCQISGIQLATHT